MCIMMIGTIAGGGNARSAEWHNLHADFYVVGGDSRNIEAWCSSAKRQTGNCVSANLPELEVLKQQMMDRLRPSTPAVMEMPEILRQAQAEAEAHMVARPGAPDREPTPHERVRFFIESVQTRMLTRWRPSGHEAQRQLQEFQHKKVDVATYSTPTELISAIADLYSKLDPNSGWTDNKVFHLACGKLNDLLGRTRNTQTLSERAPLGQFLDDYFVYTSTPRRSQT